MKPEETKIETVYSPQQASVLAVQTVEGRKVQGAGLLTGIPGLDEVMLPLKRGDLVVVEGYTSNGKSMLMSAIANNVAADLKGADEVVVYVSWEQSVEEQTLLDISRTSTIPSSVLYKGSLTEMQWSAMMRAALERASQPIWLVGHSDASEQRRPRLTMTDVARSLAYIVDVQGRRVSLIVLDYLQRINRDDVHTTDARLGFMDIVDRAKDAALAFGCPLLLGCQAGRETQSKDWKMPGIRDGQESSNVEQSADKFLALWMPKTSEPMGSKVQLEGSIKEMTVTEHLMFLKLWKQKFGPAPKLLPLYVDAAVGKFWAMDMKSGDKKSETLL
jgi:replicative DNA helicase